MLCRFRSCIPYHQVNVKWVQAEMVLSTETGVCRGLQGDIGEQLTPVANQQIRNGTGGERNLGLIFLTIHNIIPDVETNNRSTEQTMRQELEIKIAAKHDVSTKNLEHTARSRIKLVTCLHEAQKLERECRPVRFGCFLTGV